jgi:hypothetical protein
MARRHTDARSAVTHRVLEFNIIETLPSEWCCRAGPADATSVEVVELSLDYLAIRPANPESRTGKKRKGALPACFGSAHCAQSTTARPRQTTQILTEKGKSWEV